MYAITIYTKQPVIKFIMTDSIKVFLIFLNNNSTNITDNKMEKHLKPLLQFYYFSSNSPDFKSIYKLISSLVGNLL